MRGNPRGDEQAAMRVYKAEHVMRQAYGVDVKPVWGSPDRRGRAYARTYTIPDPMSPAECRALVHEVAGAYGIGPDRLTVKMSTSRQSGVTQGRYFRRTDGAGVPIPDTLRYTIILPPWTRAPLPILHEVAHAVSRDLCGIAGHGEHWRGTFLHLLAEHVSPQVCMAYAAAFKAAGLPAPNDHREVIATLRTMSERRAA